MSEDADVADFVSMRRLVYTSGIFYLPADAYVISFVSDALRRGGGGERSSIRQHHATRRPPHHLFC